MRQAVAVVVLCVFVAVPVSADITMHTANTGTGNQAWSAVGLEFTVNAGPGIRVLELGIYDSAPATTGIPDGIQGGATLSALIFNSAQTALVQMDFTANDGSVLDGSYLFKQLGTPLVLSPGTYTIAGYGFNVGGNNEFNCNFANSGPGPTFDGGGGLISFVQSRWTPSSSAVPPAFPTTTYGLGYPDFFDAANMKYEAVPVPAAVLLGMLGLSVAGVKLRKRA